MRRLIHYMAAWSALFANPQNLNVVAGSAQVAEQGNQLEIQVSDRAVLHWESFSIASQETTRFLQPSANSAVLNCVTGNAMSQISGLLQANGQVYLVNPHGVVIGKEGRIDTAAFVATTLAIREEDFLKATELCLFGEEGGVITHLGTISSSGGPVILVAHQVENFGTIEADASLVSLAPGEELLLNPAQHPQVFIRPALQDPEALQEQVKQKGWEALVLQSGEESQLVFENGKPFLRRTHQSRPMLYKTAYSGGGLGMLGVSNPTGAVTFGNGTVIQSAGNILISAGTNIVASGTCSITTTTSSATLTMVVDTLNPSSPNYGSGSFQLSNSVTLGAGNVRLYASQPGINSFPSTINGSSYSGGTISGNFYTAGTHEQTGVYYAGGSGGSPFAVFYKRSFATPAVSPITTQTIQTAINEPTTTLPLIELLISESSQPESSIPDPQTTCRTPSVSVSIQ